MSLWDCFSLCQSWNPTLDRGCILFQYLVHLYWYFLTIFKEIRLQLLLYLRSFFWIVKLCFCFYGIWVIFSSHAVLYNISLTYSQTNLLHLFHFLLTTLVPLYQIRELQQPWLNSTVSKHPHRLPHKSSLQEWLVVWWNVEGGYGSPQSSEHHFSKLTNLVSMQRPRRTTSRSRVHSDTGQRRTMVGWIFHSFSKLCNENM